MAAKNSIARGDKYSAKNTRLRPESNLKTGVLCKIGHQPGHSHTSVCSFCCSRYYSVMIEKMHFLYEDNIKDSFFLKPVLFGSCSVALRVSFLSDVTVYIPQYHLELLPFILICLQCFLCLLLNINSILNNNGVHFCC